MDNKKSLNFSSFLGDVVNSVMESVSARMVSVNNSYISPLSGGKVTNANQDLSKIFNLDPDIYFDFLGDYSFLNALVKAYKDPIAEVIEGESITVKLDGSELERIANEGLKEVEMKKFLLEHLDSFIKRGTFTGFLNFNEKNPDAPEASISDSVEPFKNIFFERHGNLLKIELNKVRFKFDELFIYYFEKKTLNVLSKEETNEACKRKDNLKEFAGITGNSRFSAETEADTYLQKPENMSTEEWEKRKAKAKLTSDIVQFRGKSIFEPYLRDLFHLFLLEFIYGQLALIEYMRSIMVTVTVQNPRIDVRKATNTANKIETLMNSDNANIISSFLDPNVMVSQIQDKLVNRVRVLPQNTEYMSLEELRLPDWNSRLEMLKADIETRKRSIANAMSIPQEFLSDVSSTNYRWDIISRSQRFSDALVQFLSTISTSIKQFCTSYVYKKTGKFIKVSEWQHRFNPEPYLYSFMNKSKMVILNERLGELARVLLAIDELSQLPTINRSQYLDYVSNELNKIDPKLSECIHITNDRIGTGKFPTGQEEEGTGQGFSRKVPHQFYVDKQKLIDTYLKHQEK